MINPLTEQYTKDKTDENIVLKALAGDKTMLEELVKRHQEWIYNIALRMVFYSDDAKDITQEVLVKIITKLGTFEGRSSFRTWAYRIAVNHILNTKKSRGEKSHHSDFISYGKSIDMTPDGDYSSQVNSPDSNIVVEEIKLSCMFGMLLCLDREQRIVFILGGIFGVTDKTGSEILEITPDAYRQKLSRARKELFNFMHNKCGLVNKSNPCRCQKKTKALVESGYVNPEKLQFNKDYIYKIENIIPSKLEKLNTLWEEKCNKLFLEHPFQNTEGFIPYLRKILNTKEFRNIFNFN